MVYVLYVTKILTVANLLILSFEIEFQLYRDCLRLIRHIAPGSSPKANMLRLMCKTEFAKNRNETDEGKIEIMRGGAIRALSNYMLYENGAKDAKLGKAMASFNDNVIKGSKRDKNDTIKTPPPRKLQFPPGRN